MQHSGPSSTDVPPKRLHWAAFGVCALFAFLGLGLLWVARYDGLQWRIAAVVAATAVIPSSLAFLVGLLLRKRYLKRRRERENYLRVIDRIAETI